MPGIRDIKGPRPILGTNAIGQHQAILVPRSPFDLPYAANVGFVENAQHIIAQTAREGEKPGAIPRTDMMNDYLRLEIHRLA